MAILKIAKMGNPILRKVAEPVADPTSPGIAKLVEDMKDTLIDINGAGIAAPQVYVSKRVFIYHVPEHRIPDGVEMDPVPWTVLINPEIDPLGDELKMNWERCLSVPGLHGKVPRHTHVRCAYSTLEGERVETEVRGFQAMVLQHEYDHLDGILYPQRMTDLSLLTFESELGLKTPAMPWAAEDFA